MKIVFFTNFLSLFILNGLFAANVVVNHTVEKNSEKNEYRVTSVFLGASEAEFAKVSFKIPAGVNVITPSSGVNVSKKESDGVSFYSFSVGDEGVTTVFYIQPSAQEDISIGVKFVYAVGESKMKPDIENLVISIGSAEYPLYQGVTPEDNSFVIKDLSNKTSYALVVAEDKESKLIAENKVSKEVTEKIERISDSGNYSIQLLSLSDYSDIRVMEFCIKHKLKTGDLIKRNVGNLTKVSIGTYDSKEAANSAKMKMISADALLYDAFVVKLK
ncbi:MAG: SPOR domain-containing protein [Flavobacteriales bacterium]|nr:SPOR domain-containing protein [Flavobacteriales bacterium]